MRILARGSNTRLLRSLPPRKSIPVINGVSLSQAKASKASQSARFWDFPVRKGPSKPGTSKQRKFTHVKGTKGTPLIHSARPAQAAGRRHLCP